MDESTAVLKSGQFREGPPVPLAHAARPASASAAVRIVAQDAGGATLELLCECGRRTYVRCDYAAPAPVRAAVGRAPENPRPGGGA